MIQPRTQDGFSTVELLITLFIAVAFIATAYQLYSVVLGNSSDARLQAKASNIGYENLRKYEPQATRPCSVVTPSPAPTLPSGHGLGSGATVSVIFSCPFGTSSTTTKLQVSVKYGSPQQEIIHAIYTNAE